MPQLLNHFLLDLIYVILRTERRAEDGSIRIRFGSGLMVFSLDNFTLGFMQYPHS
ncbi:hypothetical protein SAMN04488601_10889 [Paenibacillus sp. 453mf]|nr:hypothetical protein SAMN04488601_10889 [Paenibacillus sp. 453mf]